MVVYKISLTKLEELVTAVSKDWLKRARKRTKEVTDAGTFDDGASIWSDIKIVFINLQHRKCAYCERKLAGRIKGKAEYDVEHYRPKGRVQPWPNANDHLDYNFPTGDANEKGYYWLAYTLENYAVACKSCNSGLKSDRFPIAGTRGQPGMSAQDLDQSERPLLIFPVGDRADDPSALIGFNGVTPIPTGSDPQDHAHQRARVTIDFFRLANVHDREELYWERSLAISQLWALIELENTSSNPQKKALASKAIKRLLTASAPHSACVNAFAQLWKDDTGHALKVAEEAIDYVALHD